MAKHNVTNNLLEAWDTVNTRWSAEAKTQYGRKIFDQLLNESEGIYVRNETLVSLGERCLVSIKGIGD